MSRHPTVAALAGLALVATACGQPGLEPIADPDWYDPEPGVLRVEPTHVVDFGRASPDAGRQRMEIWMTVEGDLPVAVSDFYLDDATSLAFTLPEEVPVPVLLQPGDEATFSVFFEPYAVGDYFGTVVVLSDREVGDDGDSGEREFELELSGEGCQDLDEDAVCD